MALSLTVPNSNRVLPKEIETNPKKSACMDRVAATHEDF